MVLEPTYSLCPSKLILSGQRFSVSNLRVFYNFSSRPMASKSPNVSYHLPSALLFISPPDGRSFVPFNLPVSFQVLTFEKETHVISVKMPPSPLLPLCMLNTSHPFRLLLILVFSGRLCLAFSICPL